MFSLFENTAQDGNDVALTVDYNIQAIAESLLADAVSSLNADGGTIIVEDPKTGAILALANLPEFNPNTFSETQDLHDFQNGAIQKMYEPGSVFKPITMAAALNSDTITPTSTYVDTGEVVVFDRTLSNYDKRTWGERTMTEVLEYSINTGAVFAQQKTGKTRFLEYLKKFGLLERTSIDLASEVYSENQRLQTGHDVEFATASFGQGIEITPLQLVRAYSAFANNGVITNPYIVTPQEEQQRDAVISSRTASQISAMLTSVVENGFGKAARVPGYYVAGKTGTAQVSWSALGEQKSGYSDQTIQSFIGYAPAFNPRFLALVKIDNPATNTAEYSAIPVFQKLAQYIVNYYEIPPDYEQK